MNVVLPDDPSENILDSDALSRAILDSIQTRIAVIAADGSIVVVNEAWERFARENGDPDLTTTGVGINYFDVMRRSVGQGDTLAQKALTGMLRVLEQEAEVFEQRYPCHSPTEERWYLMRVTPLRSHRQRGLVISHIDITTQHLSARAQMRRQQRELTVRQQAREFAAIASADTRLAKTEGPLISTDLEHQYLALLEKAFERRVFKDSDDVGQQVRAIASALGSQTAGPRDVIALHTRAMESIRERGHSAGRMQVYLEEGRLLLIEIMGFLASYYRDMIIADLEQRGI
jgi:hypothetical protein